MIGDDVEMVFLLNNLKKLAHVLVFNRKDAAALLANQVMMGAVQFGYVTGDGSRRAFDLGYHSPVPMGSGQETATESCPYVENGKCYYDGTTFGAQEPLDILICRGKEALWENLERKYRPFFSIEKESE